MSTLATSCTGCAQGRREGREEGNSHAEKIMGFGYHIIAMVFNIYIFSFWAVLRPQTSRGLCPMTPLGNFCRICPHFVPLRNKFLATPLSVRNLFFALMSAFQNLKLRTGKLVRCRCRRWRLALYWRLTFSGWRLADVTTRIKPLPGTAAAMIINKPRRSMCHQLASKKSTGKRARIGWWRAHDWCQL